MILGATALLRSGDAATTGDYAAVINARDQFGMSTDSAFNNRDSFARALTACVNAELFIPAGIYKINNTVFLAGTKNCKIKGAGRYSTTLDFSAASDGVNVTAGTDNSNITVEDIGFVTAGAGTTWKVRIDSPGMTFRRTAWNQGQSNTFGIACIGCEHLAVQESIFFGDGDISGTSQTGIQASDGATDIQIDGCIFDYTYNGIQIISQEGATPIPVSDVRIRNNLFEGGWFTQKAAASGTSTNITATVLTDTGAAFPTFGNFTNVRLMATRAAGTITAYTGARIIDSAGTPFSSASAGDIIRTFNKFAIVEQVFNSNNLVLSTWRDIYTYRFTSTPAVGAAYTLYSLVLGERTTNDATSITVSRWYDWTGAVVVPSTTTYYEISAQHPNYPIKTTANSRGIEIQGNLIRRGWSDCIAVYGRYNIISDNMIVDCQDQGVTIEDLDTNGTQGKTVVASNVVVHAGRGGISSWANDVSIVGNVVNDTRWTATSTSSLHACYNTKGDRNRIIGNLCDRGISAILDYGVTIDNNVNANSTAVDNVIRDNVFRNMLTADIRLVDSDAVNTVIGPNTFGSTPLLDGGSVGTIFQLPKLTFAQLGTPAAGSTAICTDCTQAATCAGSGTGSLARRTGTTWACN